jgi:leader peptidase (prepilin peptidase)/N-methyltransferase
VIVLCAVFGGAAGLVTPVVARRFGVHSGRWRSVVAGAVIGAALGWRLAPAGPVILSVWLVVLIVGLPLTAIDLGCRRLPDALVIPSTALVAALAAAGGEARALLGGAALAATFGVLAMLPRSALGFGDVKLSGVLGSALTLLGFGTLVRGAVLAFVLGGLTALALLISRRAGRDTRIPFGPSMIGGALVAALTA